RLPERRDLTFREAEHVEIDGDEIGRKEVRPEDGGEEDAGPQVDGEEVCFTGEREEVDDTTRIEGRHREYAEVGVEVCNEEDRKEEQRQCTEGFGRPQRDREEELP